LDWRDEALGMGHLVVALNCRKACLLLPVRVPFAQLPEKLLGGDANGLERQ